MVESNYKAICCGTRWAIVISLFIVFESVLALVTASSCGQVKLMVDNRYYWSEGTDETNKYQENLLDVKDGTGATGRASRNLCLSNISNGYPQRHVSFQPDKPTCEVLLCGTFTGSDDGECFRLGNGHGDQLGDSGYYKLFTEPYFFQITSITCGCINPSEEAKPNCSLINRCDTVNKTISGPCGAVLFERNCATCFFPPEQLKEDEVFSSCHAAAVQSVVVKPGYQIYRNGNPYIKSTSFTETKEMYSKTGEEFVCRKIPEDKQKGNGSGIGNYESPSLTVGQIILIVLGIACVLSIVVGGIFLEKHMRVRHVQRQFAQIIDELKATDFGPNGNTCGVGSYPYDSKWDILRKNIKLDLHDSSKVLGVGTFGKVIKGKLVTTEGNGSEKVVDVAVKTFHALDAVVNMNHIKALINEIRVMSFMEFHPNVVRFFGAHIDLRRGHIFCVMELCLKKSLLGHLISLRFQSPTSNNSGPSATRIRSTIENGYCDFERVDTITTYTALELTGEHVLPTVSQDEANQVFDEDESSTIFKAMVQWSCDIASGMLHLQKNDILHIDLAARNILLTSDLTAKISDFGLSRRLYTTLDDKTAENRTQTTYQKSTGLDLIPYKYIALESLLLDTYSSKSDVWSFGITLWEIFSCGLEPYGNISEPRVLQLFLQNGKRLECPEFATTEIYNKMLGCWIDEAHLRPDFEELQSFFHTIHNITHSKASQAQ